MLFQKYSLRVRPETVIQFPPLAIWFERQPFPQYECRSKENSNVNMEEGIMHMPQRFLGVSVKGLDWFWARSPNKLLAALAPNFLA